MPEQKLHPMRERAGNTAANVRRGLAIFVVSLGVLALFRSASFVSYAYDLPEGPIGSRVAVIAETWNEWMEALGPAQVTAAAEAAMERLAAPDDEDDLDSDDADGENDGAFDDDDDGGPVDADEDGSVDGPVGADEGDDGPVVGDDGPIEFDDSDGPVNDDDDAGGDDDDGPVEAEDDASANTETGRPEPSPSD